MASLVSLYYYLIIIRQIYVEPAKESTVIPITWITGIFLGGLVIGTVLIGVYPRPLMDAIQTATAVILP